MSNDKSESKPENRAGKIPLQRVVYARHGRELMGLKSPKSGVSWGYFFLLAGQFWTLRVGHF